MNRNLLVSKNSVQPASKRHEYFHAHRQCCSSAWWGVALAVEPGPSGWRNADIAAIGRSRQCCVTTWTQAVVPHREVQMKLAGSSVTEQHVGIVRGWASDIAATRKGGRDGDVNGPIDLGTAYQRACQTCLEAARPACPQLAGVCAAHWELCDTFLASMRRWLDRGRYDEERVAKFACHAGYVCALIGICPLTSTLPFVM